MTIVCADCGVEVERTGRSQKRCGVCADARTVLRAKEYNRKYYIGHRNGTWATRITICTDCGDDLGIPGTPLKRCPGCVKKKKAAHDATYRKTPKYKTYQRKYHQEYYRRTHK